MRRRQRHCTVFECAEQPARYVMRAHTHPLDALDCGINVRATGHPTFGIIQIPDHIITDPRITPVALGVLAIMAASALDADDHMTYGDLTARTGSARTLASAVRTLVDCGYLIDYGDRTYSVVLR
ncbi:hypothetical protein [Deinococcus arenicola]|uniref:MarR family transcriptional regulator n=1 Tax=Deinococcus arenicola TaxID=2994950 RepID=A0ABU4DVF3_9DEIO|nr:hypothetical protein [Deinococcus sp. ZS9-10]MDV6376428.1 hypothetical protein [Deinococcus sp. ZS9-10]